MIEYEIFHLKEFSSMVVEYLNVKEYFKFIIFLKNENLIRFNL